MMVFSSAIFLFLFLPATILADRILLENRLKNTALIAASLIFYAFGEPVYICLMLFSAGMNYFLGRLAAKDGAVGKTGLWLAVFANVALLGVFKYADFFMETLNHIFALNLALPGIRLPIGISFFTFQAMSYVIDVYREKGLCQRRFPELLLYISFFPQLVAGPIIKYKDIRLQLHTRVCCSEKTAEGLRRFTIGLAKKLLIANTMGQTADLIFSLDNGQLNIMLAWLGAITYTLQIYYDFSGYSDMAIGLGKVFGFQFKENFNYPYQSASIKEFWRRWHISLSTWFKEYLYIPLGGNRKGTIRTNINKLIVFFTTGLWHGANWTFVLWGMIHGLFSMLESSRYFPFTKRKWCGHIYTMAVVTTAFVLFRADDVQQGMHIIGQMYSGFHFEEQITALFLQQLDPLFLCVFAAGVIFLQPVKVWLENKVGERGWVRYLTLGLSLLLLLVCICNLSASTFNPFIYFRF